jgi:hypothetical protein
MRSSHQFAKGPDVERTGWIFGMGYDDALLGRHYAERALALAKSFGYTTISEGRAFASNHEDLASYRNHYRKS